MRAYESQMLLLRQTLENVIELLQQEKQMHCQRQIDDHDSDVGFFLGV
jgi:hypothetical protein